MNHKIGKNKKRLKAFILLSVLGLIFLNFTFISAYVVLQKYGDVTLAPGEKYTMNIPFIGPSKNPQICGTAIQTDNTPVSGINVSAVLSSNDEPAGSALTDSNGKYCINLPEITANKNFNIYIKYDNATLELANSDYSLKFDNNIEYSKVIDTYAFLSGEIANQNAEINNGRFEVNLKYYDNTTSQWEEIFGYQKYYLNIEPNDLYKMPNAELNVSWKIPDNAKTGKYKFYVKTSFNAKDKTSNVYFNLI